MKEIYIVPGEEKSKEINLSEKERVEYDKYDRNLEEQSEKGYMSIANRVVDISGNFLNEQNTKKSILRKIFTKLFSILLFIQLAAIIVFIVLNAIKKVDFNISDNLLTTFIVSVFVETLGSMTAMIAFAYSSKEESNIVNILTTVIQNYQKYNRKNGQGDNSPKDNKGK